MGRGKACLACGSGRQVRELAVVSAFFAARALLAAPEVVGLMRCEDCATAAFDLEVSEAALARLYAGYRGEAYFAQRHALEPWYSRAHNDGLGGDAAMAERRAVMAAALTEAGVMRRFGAALDHGGDRGQMLLDLPADRKAAFEISGAATEAGVAAVGAEALAEERWDLILCCHVLEHLIDPGAHLQALAALGGPGTVFFFEVPDEVCRSYGGEAGWRLVWLRWIVRRRGLFTLFDFVSTGLRVKFSVVPPMCAVALREHLTYFSVAGMRRFVEGAGLSVLSAGVLGSGHIGVVAVKPGSA